MTRISRRTFLSQAGVAALAGTGIPLLAQGASQPASRYDVPLTLDLRDATSPEAAGLLFKIKELNYAVDRDVYGFVTSLAQNVLFSRQYG